MSQYPPPPPGPPDPPQQPDYPTGGYPPQQGYPPPGGWQEPQSGYPPPPGGYPLPPGGYPQQGYGPPQGYPGQPQQQQRRRGCGGCLLGCVVALVAACLVAGVIFVAAVMMFRTAFPTAESFGEATQCTALRAVITGAETMIDSADMSPAERQEAQQALRELRAEFEQECGAQP